MYERLSAFLKKPELYEKTRENFWNDPHISKGMLEAHLDPNTDAASRKPEFIDSSVEWIGSLLPHGAKLLDIGCGPGLYAKRFSEHGLCVTGLDFSDRSITYAKEHDFVSEYVLQSYLQMDYENTFDMITMIWCDYGALIPQDRHDLLGRIFRALKPGGLFLFDVFTPKWYAGRKEKSSWEVCKTGGFWSPNPYICMNAEYYYGDNTAAERYVVIEKEAVRCFNIWNTSFTKESLLEELQPYGVACVNCYSDVSGKPYEENSPTLCAVVKKHEK